LIANHNPTSSHIDRAFLVSVCPIIISCLLLYKKSVP
jgi:hypothetical protein